MALAPCVNTAPVPPPAYHRAQAKGGVALHLDALTLIHRLHLLALCRLAVRLAQRRCPPPLRADPGGHPRLYSDASLLLLGLLRTLWRLSYQDLHDWLVDWPALALACGLPRAANGRICVPSPTQQCKRCQGPGHPATKRSSSFWSTSPASPAWSADGISFSTARRSWPGADPPLVALSVDNTAHSLPIIRRTRHFAVNILAADERELSGRLGKSAVKHPEKLDGLRFAAAADGEPVLADAPAWVVCEVLAEMPAGDSTLVLGRVVDAAVQRKVEPLTMLAAGFKHAG